MRAGASAVLATGRASIVDLVTLTVPRQWFVSPTGFFPIPGAKEINATNRTYSDIRPAFALGSKMYALSGGSFYEFDETTKTLSGPAIGSGVTATRFCVAPDNRVYGFADGSNLRTLWEFTISPFTKIAHTDIWNYSGYYLRPTTAVALSAEELLVAGSTDWGYQPGFFRVNTSTWAVTRVAGVDNSNMSSLLVGGDGYAYLVDLFSSVWKFNIATNVVVKFDAPGGWSDRAAFVHGGKLYVSFYGGNGAPYIGWWSWDLATGARSTLGAMEMSLGAVVTHPSSGRTWLGSGSALLEIGGSESNQGSDPVFAPSVHRWTSHDRPLRFQGAVFQGLPGTVWTRGPRSDQAGSEVSTLACSVAGDLPVSWRTHPTDTAQVDQIDLSELAVLGLLEGATLQIDEAVLDSLPAAPAGESAADLPIGQVTTAVVLGEVVEASLDALSVAMRVRSFQHRAGASVPRAVFAPTCRWDFAGPECGYASQWAERTALETTEESIRLSALQAEDFGSVVPLSGRNMGIRRTLGVGDNDGLERTYALPEPWPWPMADNTPVAVGFECSKGLSALTGRPSCTMLLRQARFGGFAGMPPPEGS